MKLGENMTATEACNGWSEVCPRKSRPPHIGDIPRHVAIDEESPSSSFPLPATSQDITKPIFKTFDDSHDDANVYVTHKSPPVKVESQSTVFHKLPISKCLENRVRVFTRISSAERRPRLSIADKIRVARSSTLDSSVTQGTAVSRLLSVKEKLTSTIGSLDGRQEPSKVERKRETTHAKYERSYIHDNLIQQSSSTYSLEKLPEDIDRDSRKDSAVCLEETEELDALKERLLESDPYASKTSNSCKLPPLLTTQKISSASALIYEDTEEEKSKVLHHPSLAKYYRPRRESSGYSSNLSTFDEDRRNSTTDTLQSFTAHKDRRRSSAKKLNIGRFAKEEEIERMPTSEVYRKISTAGLEMPNITELKEITEDVRLSSKDDIVCLPTLDIFPDISVVKERRRFSKKIYDKNDETETLEIIKERGDIDQTKEHLQGILQSVTEPVQEKDIKEIKDRLSQSTLTIDNNGKNPVHRDKFSKSSIPSISSLDVLSKTIDTSVQKKPEELQRFDYLRQHKESSRTETNKDGRFKLENISNTKEKIVRSQSCNFQERSSLNFLKHLVSTSNSSPKSQRPFKQVTHQYSTSLSSTTELESIAEKPQNVTRLQNPVMVINDGDDDNDVEISNSKSEKENVGVNILSRSVKVYQLLSTQSEDHGDDEPRLMDRRISLQIPRHDEEESLPCTTLCTPEDKRLLHTDSSPLLQISKSVQMQDQSSRLKVSGLSPVRKLSSPGEVEVIQRMIGDNGNVGIRPIYPYCPYSPYGSPQGSPRIRRRPLRESRRVSIDNRQGAFQLNQYKLLDTIGQGSYGIVKLAYNEEDETHYAMKILSKKKLMKKAGIFGRMAPGRKGVSNPLAKVYREIALLKKLDHPNVVKLVEVLDDPEEDNLYLVFELVQKGEVLQLPTDKPLDEETARTNFRDVVLGVEYLHYQRIVHRDIKPSNLLVDSEGHVKVADLGVSAELRASGELLSGSAGTPAFAAPETTVPGAQYSGTLCDVWSMGVTLYSLVTGKVPWDGSGSIIGVQAAVRTEPLRFPEKPELSEDLRDLITRMLTKDPAVRCSLQEIKTHRWLTNHGKEPLLSEADNCRLPVTVTDEEVARVVTRIPKLDTLILIKTMLKQHSFQNPFLPKKSVKPSRGDVISGNLELPSTSLGKTRDLGNQSKTAQFHRAGRSNSAPDSYEWQAGGKQTTADPSLPPVTEVSIPEIDVGKR
ncbi:uncharacterized protein [Chelonus insularis]|uniref:uncharacterized protein n=1 Tax=Chelonus insularis TaxID=460826 RepID=UPI00158E0A99|nr:uncharacterized protein LOC118066338 [Chelonus insularis]